jgi:hypothetical protein
LAKEFDPDGKSSLRRGSEVRFPRRRVHACFICAEVG